RFLNHNYVGTEHLLLGVLREQEGVAAQVLMNLGLRLSYVREAVLAVLGGKLDQDIGKKIARKKRKKTPLWKRFPEPLRSEFKDLMSRLTKINEEKEQAIAQQDFDKAA